MVAAIKANPLGMSGAYTGCVNELRADLGPAFAALDHPGLELVFASIVAHKVASYGTSYKICLHELLSESKLACDNYAYLTDQLVQLLPDPPAHGALHMLGFDHGAVGNHAQLFLSSGPLPIMVDPTIGLVAVTTLDGVLGGQPIPVASIASFYSWSDPYIVGVFLPDVYGALAMGRYKASDVIYNVLPEDVVAVYCGP